MKTRVWTLPTRLFHWMLAIGFIGAYVLGEEDDLRNLHFAFGALVGGLALLRLLFGILGPRYSHFRDFHIGWKHQLGYLKNISRPYPFPGHNPAAALVMLAILGIALLTTLTGYITYAGSGTFPGLPLGPEGMEDAHKALANIFLALVIVHLAGILVDTLLHARTGTLASMFSGDKNVEGQAVQLNGFQWFFSLVWIVVPLVLFFLALRLDPAQGGAQEREGTEQHDPSEEED
ncbi:MAG TPA: cytochrome b/b6 domain-containing protein [Bacteroidales bacterium]|nr:cytochrome b/b6 domain-containing protein [Bacteroidales bacterium]HRZ75767.1 cytochrome b/b6 domain-containing protein [Bacteroidales bacterium]